jgi:hypothetical protein
VGRVAAMITARCRHCGEDTEGYMTCEASWASSCMAGMDAGAKTSVESVQVVSIGRGIAYVPIVLWCCYCADTAGRTPMAIYGAKLVGRLRARRVWALEQKPASKQFRLFLSDVELLICQLCLGVVTGPVLGTQGLPAWWRCAS